MVIYTNNNKSIIVFDIINEQKINEIKYAHNNTINNFRHYSDIKNNRDLFISISSKDANIKMWNVNNFDCLLNLRKIYSDGCLFSACFLKDKNKSYILSSKYNCEFNLEQIKVFDFQGKKSKSINKSADKTLFIDSYLMIIFVQIIS